MEPRNPGVQGWVATGGENAISFMKAAWPMGQSPGLGLAELGSSPALLVTSGGRRVSPLTSLSLGLPICNGEGVITPTSLASYGLSAVEELGFAVIAVKGT